MTPHDPACFRLECIPSWRLRKARAVPNSVRTLEWAKRCLGVLPRRVRQEGQSLWQWSNPALPHDVRECR